MDRYVVHTKSPNVSPSKRKREEEEEEQRALGVGGSASPQKKARKAKGKEKAIEVEHEHEHEHEVEEHTTASTTSTTTVLTSAKKKNKTATTIGGTLPAGVVAKWTDDGGVEGMEAVRLLDGGLFRRHPQFIEPDEAARIFAGLMRDIPWLQSDIRVYGKTYKYSTFAKPHTGHSPKNSPHTTRNTTHRSPRMQCWMADDDVVASTYLKTQPTPWSDDMRALRQRLERTLGCRFNYLLLNLYRDGRDHISFHADREAIPEVPHNTTQHDTHTIRHDTTHR
jgi:hypothetical protein